MTEKELVTASLSNFLTALLGMMVLLINISLAHAELCGDLGLDHNRFAEQIRALRQDRIGDSASDSNRWYGVGGQNYWIVGRLGRSVATVYLAQDGKGNYVSLKIYPRKSIALFNYEKYATEGALSVGIRVPKIIHHDPEQGIVVKEYFYGLSYREFEVNWNELGLSYAQKQGLQEKLEKRSSEDRMKMGQAAPMLIQKYGEESLKEQVQIYYNDLIKGGDFRDANYLYSPTEKDWLPFDP